MKTTGFIVFGPKETIRDSLSAEMFYTPTPQQRKNIKEMFGWEYVTNEEASELLKKEGE